MHRSRFVFPLILSLLTLAPLAADFEKEFEGNTGTFVLLDGQTGETFIHNPERAKTRFSPNSTFKIPNSLIALDTKVVETPSAVLKWDEKKHPRETHVMDSWAADMNIKDAFKMSCVWFYKEIAEKVGQERMKQYLKEFNYGNQDISGGLTQFWLTSSLKISANEQVRFLKDLHERKYKLSPSTYEQAENEIFIEEKTPEYILRSKTGTGRPGTDEFRGWYVGYVTRGEKTWYFALNMDFKDKEGKGMMKSGFTEIRKKIARSILKSKGIID